MKNKLIKLYLLIVLSILLSVGGVGYLFPLLISYKSTEVVLLGIGAFFVVYLPVIYFIGFKIINLIKI